MIHPTAIVHPNVTWDELPDVEPFCIIGSSHGRLHLTGKAIIRSHSIIEGGNTIGPDLETGHHVLIRTGNEIGTNLRIGTMSRLEGGGVIGDYVRIHGDCEMTKGELRHFSRVYGGSYITDNRLPPSRVNVPAILDEGSVLCMNSVVIAGVRLGVGSFVGANSTVSRDVPDGQALVGGVLRPVTNLHWDVPGAEPIRYPWTGYYRDYPAAAQSRLAELHQRIMAILGVFA